MTVPGSRISPRSSPSIENLYFLINMQYRRHLGLELRVPSLHIVTNLMRPKFSLHQDLMQLGALLIENLQGFLLELGKGFALVAHQRHQHRLQGLLCGPDLLQLPPEVFCAF